MKTMKNKNFLLEAPPEDESTEDESSMLDYILGGITISALLILLFVVVPILFG